MGVKLIHIYFTKGEWLMQTIRAGDLYFLKSPFHADDHDTDKEKRLCYLLGTVSARPAIVIKPPVHWDPFNMVTIIPALSRGTPAITLHLEDRYGRETKSDYPFLPHHAVSIPVSRLGRYIGSLDPEELAEIMEAFHWVMDPARQADPNVKIPRVYQHVSSRKLPRGSWIYQGDPRSNVDVRITKGGVLKSPTNPEIDGVTVEESRDAIQPKAEEYITRDPVFVPAETPLPDAVPEEVRADAVVVPVEKSFPPSIYPTDVLQQIAGRFDIDEAYYRNMKPRNPYVITDWETLVNHRLSKKDFDRVLDYYTMMTPLDAMLLGPRLPTHILQEITEMDRSMTTVLKLVCNVLRDMPDEKYEEYVKADAERSNARVEQQNDQDTVVAVDYRPMLDKVKPYLNPKSIDKLPDSLRDEFSQIPKGILKRAWNGKSFETYYKKAIAG